MVLEGGSSWNSISVGRGEVMRGWREGRGATRGCCLGIGEDGCKKKTEVDQYPAIRSFSSSCRLLLESRFGERLELKRSKYYTVNAVF
jgi:hypothetical protein